MIPDENLREVLEIALAALQVLDRKKDVIQVPKAAQPLLRFKKLNKAGLATLRRVLEEHDEIRSAVAEGIRRDPEGGSGHPIDPLALLWLTRPEGWEQSAEQQLAEVAERKRLERLALEEKSAEKRLAAAERHLERVRGDLTRRDTELEQERARRQEAERSLRESETRRRSLEQQLEEARAETRRAKQGTEDVQSAASDARLALDAETQRRQEAEDERDSLASRLEDALRDRVEAEAQRRGSEPATRRDDTTLLDATRSLRDAANALTVAADAVAAMGVRSAVPAGPSPNVPGPSGGGRAGQSRSRRTRTPISIPGGRYGDEVAVATYLLALPRVEVLVDGYNVAMTAWPGVDLEAQRVRLVAASEDLVRRVGTRVRIVFDGADVPGWSTGRRLVSVQFSSAGTIADDLIRSLVSTLPAEQKVVVVTSDKDLVASVRAMGANTISSQQFIAALGR